MGPEVLLVFPPLVETSFGNIYPATAVLSAWLEKQGITAQQRDLNAEFSEYLLSDTVLGRIVSGTVPSAPADSLTVACARWAEKNRARLIDAEGRHLFHQTYDKRYAIEEIAKPFLIDPDSEALKPLVPAQRNAHPLDSHLDFIHRSGIVNEIPSSVKLVGLSVPMGPQLVPSLLLAEQIKAAHPFVRVVLGGSTLSLMDLLDLDELLRNHRSVDAIVRFDGEKPLAELSAMAIADRWAPNDVPGVSFADADASVHHMPPATGISMAELPRPLYQDDLIARLEQPTLSVTQARGCYWGKCDYCDFVELYDGSPPFRGRHPSAVVDEMEHLSSNYGITKYTLITESIPPAFARKMCQLLLDRGMKMRWDSFAMVDRRFDRELLALMVEAGCQFLVIGMETMVTRVLKSVHKSADREENLRFLRDAHEVGIKLSVNLIPDLPSTTYEEAMQALADMKAMAYCVDSVSVFPFEATRSSNVGRTPDRFGLLPMAEASTAGQAQYALNHFRNVDPAMTPEQRTEIHARYREFARLVNRRHEVAKAFPVEGFGDPDAKIRIRVEDLDFLDTGDSIVCTHIGAKERIIIPAAAARFLRPLIDGSEFTPGQLFGQMGTPARVLLDNLAKSSMLASGQGERLS